MVMVMLLLTADALRVSNDLGSHGGIRAYDFLRSFVNHVKRWFVLGHLHGEYRLQMLI